MSLINPSKFLDPYFVKIDFNQKNMNSPMEIQQLPTYGLVLPSDEARHCPNLLWSAKVFLKFILIGITAH